MSEIMQLHLICRRPALHKGNIVDLCTLLVIYYPRPRRRKLLYKCGE